MSLSKHLVLWVHVAFVIFTIGPVTVAILSTPRYIRQRDVRIVRYLSGITFVFTLGSLGVLIAGFALASMLHDESKPWLIVSATLFLVTMLILVLIVRDQRKAIKALEDATTAAAAVPSADLAVLTDDEPDDATAADQPPSAGQQDTAAASQAAEVHLASVERGRIAMMGGIVCLIWLVILVLMIWNG